jgi:hypothetical protein
MRGRGRGIGRVGLMVPKYGGASCTGSTTSSSSRADWKAPSQSVASFSLKGFGASNPGRVVFHAYSLAAMPETKNTGCAGRGERVGSGWLGAGSWRLYTLAHFEEGELGSWGLGAGVSTLLPTLRGASSGAGGRELGAGSWRGGWGLGTLMPTLRRASSGAGGGELGVGGWLGLGSLLSCQLRGERAPELAADGWESAAGWELASLHSCQL